MIVTYASKRMRLVCTDERACKKLRPDLVDKVKMRHNALEVAKDMKDLARIDPGGKWHPLTGDREGTWAGRLSKNYRMIVRPYGDGVEVVVTEESSVEVVEIVDYH